MFREEGENAWETVAALYAGCLKEYSIALLYINQLHHIEDHRDLAVFATEGTHLDVCLLLTPL